MIRLTDVSKRYGGKMALAPLSVSFADHSFTCLVGKSGCGKTTLLRLLAGLEEKTTGRIEGLPRRVAPVFQEPRLMQWLTVAQNIAFAARGNPALWGSTPPDGTASRAVARHPKVAGLLDRLGLSGDSGLYPAQLSGGMAQRVSLGRTLFYDPELILMDEPFSALPPEPAAHAAPSVPDGTEDHSLRHARRGGSPPSGRPHSRPRQGRHPGR